MGATPDRLLAPVSIWYGYPMTMEKQTLTALLLAAFMLAPTGCKDPAGAKPKAEVASAKPTVTATATATATASSAPPATDVQRYELVAGESQVDLIVSKATGPDKAGFKTFSGTARPDGAKIEGGSFDLTIDTSSVQAEVAKLTDHLKSADFLDVERYPEATFVSTKVEKGGKKGATHEVTGNLTLHGVLKSITFAATIELEGDTMRVKSEISIKREDFAIAQAGKPGSPVVLKLDLKLKRK